MSKHLGFILLLFFMSHLRGEVTFLVGVEDWAREPYANQAQTWAGLELDSREPLIGPFRPFIRCMVGLVDKEEILLTGGLAYEFHPLKSLKTLTFKIQTGPSYTDAGEPHTSSSMDWTTDVRLQYKYFVLGYTHTSNAGLADVNSGLDMVLIGVNIPFGRERFPWYP